MNVWTAHRIHKTLETYIFLILIFCQLVLNRFLILKEVLFYSQHIHTHCKIIQEYVYRVNLGSVLKILL